MPLLKLINEPYRGSHTLEHVLRYVLRSADVGGLSVDPDHALQQMQLVKQLWHKTQGRQVRHFIISFALEEFPSPEEMLDCAYCAAGYYAPQYQIVWATHYDAANLHIHFALNTVSFLDGHMYSEGTEDYLRLLQHLRTALPQWRWG